MALSGFHSHSDAQKNKVENKLIAAVHLRRIIDFVAKKGAWIVAAGATFALWKNSSEFNMKSTTLRIINNWLKFDFKKYCGAVQYF